MKSNNDEKSRSRRLGCGFLLTTGIVMVALLVINGMFVHAFFSVNFAGIDDRVFHAAQFVLPIVMIFIELWCYDLFTLKRKNRE